MSIENQRAFLALIAHSEGTDLEPDPYRVTFGYRHTIVSFLDHPAVTREWLGEPLPDAICRAAGLSPGCRSTAAGRYQIIRPTWVGVRDRLRLRDFQPDMQDAAALYLIAQRGALDDVLHGRIQTAIEKCRLEWASLPGAGYGQRERKVDELLAAFTEAGGKLA
jgi:muramidase (phage lysozyme)